MRDDRYRMRMVLAEWAAHDRTRRRLEKEIEDCIDELEAVADPKTPALTGMPGGGRVADRTPIQAERMAWKRERIEERIKYLKGRLERADRLYHNVDEQIWKLNPRDREIICWRFKQGLKVEEVQAKCGYNSKRGMEDAIDRILDALHEKIYPKSKK